MKRDERPILFDADIRLLLFDYLDFTYAKVRTFEEKVVGKSRSDVVVLLPDKIVGVEIKSDADSYTRLSGQVKSYDRYFDENYILIGESHKKHAEEHIPSYWGILYADQTEEEPIIRELRAPSANPKAKIRSQLSFMWRSELSSLMKRNSLPAYRGKSRKFVTDTLIQKVDGKKLKEQMCDILFERDYSIFEKNDD